MCRGFDVKQYTMAKAMKEEEERRRQEEALGDGDDAGNEEGRLRMWNNPHQMKSTSPGDMTIVSVNKYFCVFLCFFSRLVWCELRIYCGG